MKAQIGAAAVIMAAMLTLFAAGCSGAGAAAAADDTKNTDAATESEPAGTEAEPPETDSAADPATELVTSPNPGADARPVTDENGTEPENPPAASKKPINPLTGLAGTEEMMALRPAAIMINNLKQACPQAGISKADVIYEMMAEGGITRLMALVTDYVQLDTVGSVRSAREYYVDMAQNHDAVFVHAGGAATAYTAIQSRKINNLDGVNMYTPDTFYRDASRASQMGLEHSLMTTGKGIESGISYKNYRTEIKDGFISPLHFIDYESDLISLSDGTAKHIIIPYNNYNFPQYIYRQTAGVYSRYQFNGKEHIDSETGEILKFTNIIVIVCKHSYSGDSYGHIGIETTGSGIGYYFTRGTFAKIKWSKKTVDSPIVFTYEDGSPLYLNCGKTFINVVDRGVFDNITFNYKKPN